MNRLTHFFTQLMRKYLPDPFVFAIGLTLLTFLLAITVEGKDFFQTVTIWGDGFWDLLEFTMQMSVILAMGYVLANAPIVDRLLDRLVSKVHSPKAAIVVATLVGGIGSYLNWGFGLVVGGVVAKKLALRIKGIHYPLIIAAAYSGFTLYGLGLSSSIPVLIATPDHSLVKQMGIISLSDTIFSWPMLLTSLIIIITLPILNMLLHPKNEKEIVELDPDTVKQEKTADMKKVLAEYTLASRLNNSAWLNWIIGIIGIIYCVLYFRKDGNLDLNMINFIILFLGILLLKTPARYVATLNKGIHTISGILLQYPFYAGIMAIMAGSGLVDTIANFFVKFSDAHTLPFWGLVSSFVINFFAPSAGGHWVVQGPFMIEAAKQLGASLSQSSMSVMLGNAWNDLVQPFWILPALALSGLKLKDVMSYTVISMLWVGLIYIAILFAWGYGLFG